MNCRIRSRVIVGCLCMALPEWDRSIRYDEWVEKGEVLRCESVFAALYLRGLSDPALRAILRPNLSDFCEVEPLSAADKGGKPPECWGRKFSNCVGSLRRWPRVEDVLRRESPTLDRVGAALRRNGLWDEAAVLDEPGRLSLGCAVVQQGLCKTVFSADYPAGWRRSLGAGAPPAVWSVGVGAAGVPAENRLEGVTAVVGGRTVSGRHLDWATAVGRAVAESGQRLVSGRAVGVDQRGMSGFAAAGGSGGLEILPHGLGRVMGGEPFIRREEECNEDSPELLSVAGWGDGFSTASAMERNALIYALADRAVVIGPRWRQGGTWHGAVDALRRRLCRVYVAMDGSDAVRALVALGAIGLRMSGDAGEMRQIWRAACLLEPEVVIAQPDLFGSVVVRERQVLGFDSRSAG